MFSHLLVTSEYSFYESTIRIKDYVRYGKQLGFSHLVVSDHNSLAAHHEFYRACLEEGIQPVYGVVLDLVYRDETVPFLVIAKDNKGYQELIQLVYLFSKEGSLSLVHVNPTSSHLAWIAYGEGGYLDAALLREDGSLVLEQLQQLKKDFPSIFVAISYNENQKFQSCNRLLKRQCESLCIPTLAIPKVYYLQPEDVKKHHLLQVIEKNGSIQDPSIAYLQGRYLYSLTQMEQDYDSKDLENVSLLLEECRVDLSQFQTKLPTPSFLKGVNPKDYLAQLVFLGLQKRLKTSLIPKEYQDRMNQELRLIVEKGFENYFLIAFDAVRFAHEKGLMIGPGRGSSVGSLVAYAIGITQIDPVSHGLLFERFLNPDRVKMPDIDLDIASEDRPFLIEHLQQEYGFDHVASISTYNRLASVEVVSKVAKALGLKEREEKSLLVSLKKARRQWKVDDLRLLKEKDRGFSNALKQSRACQEVYDLALGIEGLKQSESIHPAGIVLSDRSLLEVAPVVYKHEGLKLQWDKDALEDHGMIKMDYLSLIYLDRLKAMLSRLKTVDLRTISLEEKACYEVLKKGWTLGLFQLDAPYLRQQLSRLSIQNFMDLVNVLGLARPQAIHQIPAYLKNEKLYPKQIQSLVDQSHGVFIFQEQVMKLLVMVCGIPFGKAETIRKEGSNHPEWLAPYQSTFESIHSNLWAIVQEFTKGFGFNYSHGLAYGLLAYQTLFLKTFYPGVFYETILRQSKDDTSRLIRELWARKIRFQGFSINHSPWTSEYDGKTLNLGLDLVPSVVDSLALVQDRKQGLYINLFEAVARLSLLGVNKEAILNLIKVGAMDEFGFSRTCLLKAVDAALMYAQLCTIQKDGQKALNFQLVSLPSLVDIQETLDQKRLYEQEVLGYSSQKHPTTLYRELSAQNDLDLAHLQRNPEGWALACVSHIKKHQDKTGHWMAFVEWQDDQQTLESILFSKLFESLDKELQVGELYRIKGRRTARGTMEITTLERVILHA